MIEGIGFGLAGGLGVAIAFAWYAINAYRKGMDLAHAVGIANEDRLTAERRADASDRAKFDSDANAAAAVAELDAAKKNLTSTEATLQSERLEKARLYALLAKAGAPVGDSVVDASIGGLYPDGDQGGGSPGGGTDPGSGGDRRVPDAPPGPAVASAVAGKP